MFTWPSSMPPPDNDFQNTLLGSAIRTQMESGAFRQRKRFTNAIRQFQATWTLSDAELLIFESIYANELSQGTCWFNMSLPLGNGFKTYKVRFVADQTQPPQATYDADSVMFWTKTATMETDDDPTIAGYALSLAIAALSISVLPGTDFIENAMATFADYDGDLQLNDIFGILNIPVAGSVQFLSYCFAVAPTGSAAIVQLLDASNAAAATFTLAATVIRNKQLPDGGLPILLDPTKIYHWKITQIGATLPGSTLSLSPNIY